MENRITGAPSPRLKAADGHGGRLAVVSLSGDVLINWARVEATAADPDTGQMWFTAKLLMAARDGTAGPLADGPADGPLADGPLA
jgi:hypothetical protein